MTAVKEEFSVKTQKKERNKKLCCKRSRILRFLAPFIPIWIKSSDNQTNWNGVTQRSKWWRCNVNLRKTDWGVPVPRCGKHHWVGWPLHIVNLKLNIFCAVVAEINRSTTVAITIRYFEKGHTFRSADSFHASAERNMRQREKLMNSVILWNAFLRPLKR